MNTVATANNAEKVAMLYEAFGRGDISLIMEHVSDDCVWIGAGEGSLPEGGRYIGKDAINFFMHLQQNQEFNEFRPMTIGSINENEVVAFGNMDVTSKLTGKKISSEWAMRWKFNKDGKVVYFHDFFDTAAAYLANQE